MLKYMTIQTDIRPAAVAGLFYPDNPVLLRESITQLLEENPASGPVPKAVIAPHAGYIYSGPVAARAYNRVAAGAGFIRRVVVMGPAHRVALQGIALPTARKFRTPLGDITLDQAAIERILELPAVGTSDAAHKDEHSLEVQLPFLQSVLDEFTLVPLVVGGCSTEQVATLLERLWDDRETLVVISSDLSHYHAYALAERLDLETAQHIEAFQGTLDGDQACGAYPLNGLLNLARRHAMHIERLDLRNSGDTAGSRDRVVGYGAWAIHDT